MTLLSVEAVSSGVLSTTSIRATNVSPRSVDGFLVIASRLANEALSRDGFAITIRLHPTAVPPER